MVERKSQTASGKEPAAISTIGVGRGRPEVIVEFLFDRGLLHISVNNIGDRPAINVSVKFLEKILGIYGPRNSMFLKSARAEISFVPLIPRIFSLNFTETLMAGLSPMLFTEIWSRPRSNKNSTMTSGLPRPTPIVEIAAGSFPRAV